MSDQPRQPRKRSDEREEEEREEGHEQRQGRLTVHLRDEHDKPLHAEAAVLVTENKPLYAVQHRLDPKGTGTVSGSFLTGDYSVQAAAADHNVGRTFAHVRPGETTEVTLRLPRGSVKPPGLTERLKKYGLDGGALDIQPLDIRRGQRVDLDFEQYRDRRSYTLLRPESINDVKRWVGTPDSVFGHDHPRFGPVPHLDLKELDGGAQLGRDAMPALRAIANEFIHGNSKAVQQYEVLLDTYLLARELINISIFFFTEVTIGDGAVLEVGKNSNVFVCDILHIHKNGTLSVVGDMRADIGSYEVFG